MTSSTPMPSTSISTTSYQYLKDYSTLMDQDYPPAKRSYALWEASVSRTRRLRIYVSEEPAHRRAFGTGTTGVYFSYEWSEDQCSCLFREQHTSPISNAIQTSMYNAMVGAMAHAQFYEDGTFLSCCDGCCKEI